MHRDPQARPTAPPPARLPQPRAASRRHPIECLSEVVDPARFHRQLVAMLLTALALGVVLRMFALS